MNQRQMIGWRKFAVAAALVAGLTSLNVTPAFAADGGSSNSSSASSVLAYQQALAGYAAANQAYTLAKSSNAGNQKALQQAYQDASKAYNQASQAYTQAVKAVSSAFSSEINVANKQAKQSLRGASTAELKIQANTALSMAVVAATARRDAAIAQLPALGDAPAKPTQPAAQQAPSNSGSDSKQSQQGNSNSSGKQSSSSNSNKVNNGSNRPSFSKPENSSKPENPPKFESGD